MAPNSQDYQPQLKQRIYFYAIFRGLLLTLILHLLVCLALFLLWSSLIWETGQPGLFFYFSGFLQLLYMVPAIRYFNNRGSHGVMIGLVMGASLTFLIGLPFAYACVTTPIIHGSTSQ